MSERYVTLLGAEQVQSAANTMSNAAEHMRRSADSMQHALEMNQRFMDDWLVRFQQILEKKTP